MFFLGTAFITGTIVRDNVHCTIQNFSLIFFSDVYLIFRDNKTFLLTLKEKYLFTIIYGEDINFVIFT